MPCLAKYGLEKEYNMDFPLTEFSRNVIKFGNIAKINTRGYITGNTECLKDENINSSCNYVVWSPTPSEPVFRISFDNEFIMYGLGLTIEMTCNENIPAYGAISYTTVSASNEIHGPFRLGSVFPRDSKGSISSYDEKNVKFKVKELIIGIFGYGRTIDATFTYNFYELLIYERPIKDSGLRIMGNNKIFKPAETAFPSPLSCFHNGKIRHIMLVKPSSHFSSVFRIKTDSGIYMISNLQE